MLKPANDTQPVTEQLQYCQGLCDQNIYAYTSAVFSSKWHLLPQMLKGTF